MKKILLTLIIALLSLQIVNAIQIYTNVDEGKLGSLVGKYYMLEDGAYREYIVLLDEDTSSNTNIKLKIKTNTHSATSTASSLNAKIYKIKSSWEPASVTWNIINSFQNPVTIELSGDEIEKIADLSPSQYGYAIRMADPSQDVNNLKDIKEINLETAETGTTFTPSSSDITQECTSSNSIGDRCGGGIKVSEGLVVYYLSAGETDHLTQGIYRFDYCPTFNAHGFTNWNLPNFDTLSLIYDMKDTIGGFEDNFYWTSEGSVWSNPRSIRFRDGYSATSPNTAQQAYLRCVRNIIEVSIVPTILQRPSTPQDYFLITDEASPAIKQFDNGDGACQSLGKLCDDVKVSCYNMPAPSSIEWQDASANCQSTTSFSSDCVYAAVCKPSTPCTDTDNGNRISEKGTCTDNIGSYEDECISADEIKEYECVDNTCVDSPILCTDLGRTCQSGECIEVICTTDEQITNNQPCYCEDELFPANAQQSVDETPSTFYCCNNLLCEFGCESDGSCSPNPNQGQPCGCDGITQADGSCLESTNYVYDARFDLSINQNIPNSECIGEEDVDIIKQYFGKSEPSYVDVSNNGIIDIADVSILAEIMGACEGDANYNANHDLSAFTSCIGKDDIAIVERYFGQSAPSNSILSEIDLSNNGIIDIADVSCIAARYGLCGEAPEAPQNNPPSASFNINPDQGNVPLDVTFTSTSTDPDNDPLTYSWEFRDGSTSTAENPTHRYSQPKRYVVKLTVTDSSGLSDSSQKSITVEPPTIIPPSGTWRASSVSDTTKTLWDVHFTSETNGLAVGDNGVIYKSTNSGLNWQTEPSPTTALLNSIFFKNNLGWMAGRAVVLKSDNGNAWTTHWVPTENPLSKWLTSIFFIDANIGWAVSGQNLILKTTDGGTTWTTQEHLVQSTWESIYFKNSQEGWVAGKNNILYTTDGGTTWIDSGPGTTIAHGFPTHFMSIDFVESTGWAVGSDGDIYRTLNGISWQKVPSPTTENLKSVDFIDANKGWIVGASGTILYTSNGGASWITITSPTTEHLQSVFFKDANNGWIVGTNGAILKYTDDAVLASAATQQSCQLQNAYWSSTAGTSISQIDQGTTVKLVVEGENCDGEEISFNIKEYDGFPFGIGNDPVTTLPPNVNFVGNTVQGSWIAEYQNDGFGDPEFIFKATLVSDSSETEDSNDDLTVLKSSTPPGCGPDEHYTSNENFEACCDSADDVLDASGNCIEQNIPPDQTNKPTTPSNYVLITTDTETPTKEYQNGEIACQTEKNTACLRIMHSCYNIPFVGSQDWIAGDTTCQEETLPNQNCVYTAVCENPPDDASTIPL